MDDRARPEPPPLRGNVFEGPILRGAIGGLEELKSYYRALALRLHPDRRGARGGAEEFLRLRRDYERARAALRDAPRRAKAVTREGLYRQFLDLEASGFPVDLSVRNSSRLYRRRIEAFGKSLAALGVLGGIPFAEVERELYEIRGEDIIDNRLFGLVRMIFYNVVSWQLEPKKFTKAAVEKWLSEIEGELLSRGFPAARAFLEWLVADLGRGSALR